MYNLLVSSMFNVNRFTFCSTRRQILVPVHELLPKYPSIAAPDRRTQAEKNHAQISFAPWISL